MKPIVKIMPILRSRRTEGDAHSCWGEVRSYNLFDDSHLCPNTPTSVAVYNELKDGQSRSLKISQLHSVARRSPASTDPNIPMSGVVFIVWSGSSFGGMERRYTRLADYLSKAIPEQQVNILVQGRARKTVDHFLSDDSQTKVEAYGREWLSKRKFRNAFVDLIQLRRALLKFKNHHVHVCANPGLISTLVSLLLWRHHRKSMSIVDGTFGFNVGPTKKIHSKIAAKLYRRIDCLTSETRGILQKILGKPCNQKLRVAPCSFTDLSNIPPETYRDIDVLMLARFVEHKGYDLLQDIQYDIESLNVHVCGFGPMELGLRFSNIYKTDNPIQALSRTKIFLSLQRTNNYPSQSVLEAMASGCAIIATDVGETRKFLDEDCAVLIPYDASALRSAIEMLIKDDELRRRLGKTAKERVFREHTIERYAQYFMDEIVDLDNPHHHRP